MAQDSEKLYSLRKMIKRLAGFRGSGTQLISVFIPAGSQVHEMTNKLREELSQASNIKSKQTKTNVSDALEKIIGHLKIFKKTPENGLAVFCGNISDNPAKTDIELFSLEPPQSLRVGIYRCDSSFFLEPLERMLETRDAYGVVVLDGREATLAIVKGTEIKIVKKMNSMAHAKIKVGGQCLAAGTHIMKDDGEIVNIEDFKCGEQTVGLDFQSSKIISTTASDFFITPAKYSLVIRTQAPSYEIRATPYHRFFVLSEFGIKEKFAKNLDKEDKVLIAKKINCREKRVKTGFNHKTRMILNKQERVKLKKARLKLGISQSEVAKRIGISQMVISHLESGKQNQTKENLKKIYRLYNLDFNEEKFEKKILRFPQYWNEDLARLFGIICGDGSKDYARINIYEGSKELVDDYCSLIKRIIGIDPKVYTVDKTYQKGSFAKKPYYEIRINSAQFVEAIAQIAPGIVSTIKRDIPKDLSKCDDKIVASFLSGIYDAEGYLNAKSSIDIAMVDQELIKKIQILLLRFGIISSFSEKNVTGNKQWQVRISDKNAIISFKNKIGFRRTDKKEKLKKMSSKPVKQQYTDQIPIDGREVFRLAKELGLKTSDFHAASCFFRNKKPLGREAFAKNILPVFEKQQNGLKGRKTYRRLLEIYNSDFTVANIKNKTVVENKEDFYDITIPVHSNFVADGFIVHNSQARYQRLIEESIEKYYKRVSESMDKYFLNKVKGVMVGGPGPTKDFFLKAKDFNYQHKMIGPVDTGYTDEYGIREVLAKSESLVAAQEAIVEKKLIDRFIKQVVSEGLATYGEKQVREAIISKQADKVLLSEGLEHVKATYVCSACNETQEKIYREKPPEKIPCKCGGEAKLKDHVPLLEDLADLAKENGMVVEIVSTNTTEGAQFLTGFGGIGAFLRYKR
jgi:peptide subunit release factor 1 (eRF1)/transcriptional regulator with XRE-family HTH domain